MTTLARLSDADEALTAGLARVLAALVEKSITTPQYYPLTVNAVMMAANQKNSRHPVMSLSEGDAGAALNQLEAEKFAERDDRSAESLQGKSYRVYARRREERRDGHCDRHGTAENEHPPRRQGSGDRGACSRRTCDLRRAGLWARFHCDGGGGFPGR